MRRLTLVLVLLMATAAPALAQDEKPYDINIGGGVMFPATGLKDEFNTGGNFSIGGTYFFTPTLGFQGQYAYDRMNGPEKTIFVSPIPGGVGSAQLIESNQQINSGEFDIVARSKQGGSIVGYYVLGGPGVYHRKVQLTSPAVGYTTICDPYWYVCYPAAVSVDNIIGSRSSTDFGINFGGGVTFGHEAKFYIEARYRYVWGPTITVPSTPITGQTNTTGSTNAGYFPLVFGVRF